MPQTKHHKSTILYAYENHDANNGPNMALTFGNKKQSKSYSIWPCNLFMRSRHPTRTTILPLDSHHQSRGHCDESVRGGRGRRAVPQPNATSRRGRGCKLNPEQEKRREGERMALTAFVTPWTRCSRGARRWCSERRDVFDDRSTIVKHHFDYLSRLKYQLSTIPTHF